MGVMPLFDKSDIKIYFRVFIYFFQKPNMITIRCAAKTSSSIVFMCLGWEREMIDRKICPLVSLFAVIMQAL